MDKNEAAHLLEEAFPYYAIAYAGDDRQFLSPECWVEEVRADQALVIFLRNPGDTLGWVTYEQLREAVETGRLQLEGCLVRRPEVQDFLDWYGSPGFEEDWAKFFGPQVRSETGWIARMRLHQTWWRTFELRAAFGRGPSAGSKHHYGNMLEATGDMGGWNFLSDHARAAYDDRMAAGREGIDPFRTRRNLLSSQAMAFNLFGHLSHRPALASLLLQTVLDEPNIDVTSLEIERLSSALGDRTAFDAFAIYSHPGGEGGVAIETKLTEKFSQQDYDWAHYLNQPWFSSEVWNTDDPVRLGDRRWSQLWRNHLLLVAESGQQHMAPAIQLVVHHPADPNCAGTVDGYRALLVDPDTVRAVDIERICDILDVAQLEDEDRDWLNSFRTRYLDLERSDTLARLSG